MARFSKTNLIAALETKIIYLEATYGFDRNNGTAQLKGKLSSQEAAVAYGEFRSYLKLIENMDNGIL